MSLQTYQRHLQELLTEADVRLNGDRPWDPHVHDERFYPRLFAHGSLALGEAYMDRWWDCRHLEEFFCRVLRTGLDHQVYRKFTILLDHLVARLRNEQSRRRAREVGLRHYDIGNDLYQAMLDRRMIYSCGYWARAHTLDDAQEAKLDLICRKLDFQPGQRVLDIGCGWGGFARFAAECYGVHVVGVTISQRQADLARETCAGLHVDIRLQDYRDVRERFDHLVSIGMFEHVGYKNYRTFFEVARRCLKPEGLFLLHTIGARRSNTSIDPWIKRYIFPNSMLPSVRQIGAATEGLFVMEDWHNFGPDYARTLEAWHANVEHAWPRLAARYDERFHRMWTYYLLSCAATFHTRKSQLWQIVLSPHGIPGGYTTVR